MEQMTGSCLWIDDTCIRTWVTEVCGVFWTGHTRLVQVCWFMSSSQSFLEVFRSFQFRCTETLILATSEPGGATEQIEIIEILITAFQVILIGWNTVSRLLLRWCRNPTPALHEYYDEDFNRESFDGPRRQKMGLSCNNGIEMPLLHNGKDNFIYNSRRIFMSNSDEEMISDEEKTIGSKFPAISGEVKFKSDHLHGLETENQDETCTWSSVLKEAKELVFLDENAGSSSSYMAYSDARKISKAASGSRGKTKPRFSFRYHSHMEETPLPSIVNDGSDKSSMVSQLPVGTLECKAIDHSMTELLENLEEKKKKQSDVHKLPAKSLDVGNRHLESSMAELLEGLQDKNGHATGASKNSKTKGRRLELSTKRNTSTLSNKNLDKEEPPETIGSGTSSEDEASNQNQVKKFTPEMRVRTMADQFQEALSAAAADNREILFTTSKQIGTGYYGRLLQVMQTEKERHTEFWKQLQTGAHLLNKVRCIDVKILSRCLDAKLIVCHCSLGENTEINECAENDRKILDKGRREKTIIFSLTICDNVELEVGKLIRVHPPWYNRLGYSHPVIEYHISRSYYEELVLDLRVGRVLKM